MSMGRPSSRYKLYDKKTGKLVFTGTALQCAKFMGMKNVKNFYSARDYTKDGTYKGYRIEQVIDWDAYAVREWNKFTEPLRKKYGIPQYVEKKEA